MEVQQSPVFTINEIIFIFISSLSDSIPWLVVGLMEVLYIILGTIRR